MFAHPAPVRADSQRHIVNTEDSGTLPPPYETRPKTRLSHFPHAYGKLRFTPRPTRFVRYACSKGGRTKEQLGRRVPYRLEEWQTHTLPIG